MGLRCLWQPKVLVVLVLVGRSAELDDVLRGLRGRTGAGMAGRHRAGRD